MDPFTIVVADEATRAGGFAFDEAARVAERIRSQRFTRSTCS